MTFALVSFCDIDGCTYVLLQKSLKNGKPCSCYGKIYDFKIDKKCNLSARWLIRQLDDQIFWFFSFSILINDNNHFFLKEKSGRNIRSFVDDIAAKTGVDKDTLSNIGGKFIKNSAYRDAPMLVMGVITAIITFDFFAWTDVIDWGKNCKQSKSNLRDNKANSM